MEITKHNFSEALPCVKAAIDECDFLAVDTELTGLSTKATEHAFDTIADRYFKIRQNSMKFIIIQYGLSTFHYHRSENKYTHKDFNFYVFPRPHIKQAPDPKFMCQSSSLQFLASQNFDFNKVIYDGISFLTPTQEQKITDFLKNKHMTEKQRNGGGGAGAAAAAANKANGQKKVTVPDEHKQFIEEVHEQVESFLSNAAEKSINLEPCSSYRRKLIFESIQQKHQTGIEVSSIMNNDNKRVISIVKRTDEEKNENLNLRQVSDVEELQNAVGFRKVLDHISQSKKLVIGHNMLLDMMHTLNQFYYPIPENIDEFKDMLHMTFPQIVDTKVLASSERLRQFMDSTVLGDVAKTLRGKAFELPKIETAEGFDGYDFQSNKYHEAGFDAFLTGVSYIGLTKKLASIHKVANKFVEPSSEVVRPYLNRCFIMRHYDTFTLNLCAPDPEPERENVFYVSFPREWKTVDLVELFLPYGNIYVSWLDDVSALVALKNPENVIMAKKNLLNKPTRLYTVYSFSEYQRTTGEHSSFKRTQTPPTNSESSNKRRASGTSESMELIPEADENEAEHADNSVSTSFETKSSSAKSKASSSGPSSKRHKRYHEENDAEVTSTAKVFDEDNPW